MNPISNELKDFLNLATLPARFNKEQAAAYLGFRPDQITLLMRKGMLKPLGRPAQNSDKFFAKTTLDKVKDNEEWLSRATLALGLHCKAKNARKAKANEPISV